MSTIRRLAPGLIIVVGACALPAQAQNIDAGKSPAQIFADTCTGCHKSARELRRTGAGFLRSHYMTGPVEANAMASYLAGLPPDPRANARRPPDTGVTPPADVPRQSPRVNPAEQAKGAPNQPASKAGRRQPTAAVETHPATTASVPDEKPSEIAAVPAAPIAAPMAAVPAAPIATPMAMPAPLPPLPALEPFEE